VFVGREKGMVINMDVATLSSCMSTAELQNDIGIAVMSKALDQFEQTGEGMQKVLESSINPNLGQNIDYHV
jgi:hypothetical protein